MPKKAAEAKAEIPAAFKGAYGADLKPFPAKAPSIVDRVKLTWGLPGGGNRVPAA